MASFHLCSPLSTSILLNHKATHLRKWSLSINMKVPYAASSTAEASFGNGDEPVDAPKLSKQGRKEGADSEATTSGAPLSKSETRSKKVSKETLKMGSAAPPSRSTPATRSTKIPKETMERDSKVPSKSTPTTRSTKIPKETTEIGSKVPSKGTPTTHSTKVAKERKKAGSEVPFKSTLALSEIELRNVDKEAEEFDDGIDFPYEDPPLVCCFGPAQREFSPIVRVSNRRKHPDIYSTWRLLHWDPPEFNRAPGGPPSNVAMAHVRLGGRAAFMGKLGKDGLGDTLLLTMNQERVQTCAVKFSEEAKTGVSYMKIKFEEGDRGRMMAETISWPAEDTFSSSEVDLSVLKEARFLHFSSGALLNPTMHRALLKTIRLSKKFGGTIFFDPNLPLTLWGSRESTWELIQDAWMQSNIIEVSIQELEFLLDEEYYTKRRTYRPQYYWESHNEMENDGDYYHYTMEEIAPLWHDNIKILFVTDGTLMIHYYTPEFDGFVHGTESGVRALYTSDRTGSGDAIVAAIMRKLTIHPEMYTNPDFLERQLRFVISAGMVAQWTVGAVRCFPTESAAQNLKEQVYVPSMW